MASPYFSGPRPLAARERLVTPKSSPKPPRATQTSKRLKANERNVVPQGDLPAPLHQRLSKTSYPATSGMGALVAKTGGSYAFDKSTMRPEDIATAKKAVQHSPGVRAIAEMTRDPLGIIQAVGAAKDVVKHPGVGTGIAAGLSGAGLFFPGARKLKEVAAEAKPLERAVAAHATDEAAQVREALPGMKVARGKQAAGYAKERATRFAKAEAHLSNPDLSPDEAQALARHELRGELPKIDYKGFEHVTPEALAVMRNDIRNHPLLSTGNKINADEALMKAMAGKVPQPNQIQLLEHIFGPQTTNGLVAIAKHPKRQLILSALNIPRSVMASMDLSAPFRQGLVVATRHPAIFAKNFKPMIKAFGSENVYHAILDDIRSRPTYPLMLEAKLNMTELGKTAGAREEQFGSDLAETLTGGKRSPIRASGRAYTAFLDKTRADVFDHLLERAQTQTRIDRLLGPLGRKPVADIHDQKFLRDLGRYINSATGRGPLGAHLQGAATALNAVFFSPRLMASRLDLIFSPITYATADPFVRREALRSMFMLAGTASTLLYLASRIPGAKVVTDPRNPDWGKIKIGNTRIDIGGGFQQPLRLFAQIATGVAISSTTGKKLNLTANGFGQPTRLDLALRFFEGKESPVASFATDWLRNSDQVGNKFVLKHEVQSRLVPLLWQDTKDLYHDQHGGTNGITAAFAGNVLGTFGFGLQTYGPKKKTGASTKVDTSSYFGGGSSGGGSPYFGSSTGGAGSSYFP